MCVQWQGRVCWTWCIFNLVFFFSTGWAVRVWAIQQQLIAWSSFRGRFNVVASDISLPMLPPFSWTWMWCCFYDKQNWLQRWRELKAVPSLISFHSLLFVSLEKQTQASTASATALSGRSERSSKDDADVAGELSRWRAVKGRAAGWGGTRGVCWQPGFHTVTWDSTGNISVPGAVGEWLGYGCAVIWSNPKHVGQTWNFTAECAWALSSLWASRCTRTGGERGAWLWYEWSHCVWCLFSVLFQSCVGALALFFLQ